MKEYYDRLMGPSVNLFREEQDRFVVPKLF